MYRISVTTLEKFRRYMTEASTFDTEEALLESIQGIFKGNPKTYTGEAFHKLIEKDYKIQRSKDRGIYYLAHNILFTEAQARPALEYKKLHPSMIHEVSISKVYETSHNTILVTGRVDGLEGAELHDTKTKYRAIDFEEYMESYQWRFYEDILDLDVMHYDIFEVKGFADELGPGPIFRLPDVVFCDHESVTCNRYDRLQDDCHQLIDEFMEYIDNRNIYHLLKKAPQNAVAI